MTGMLKKKLIIEFVLAIKFIYKWKQINHLLKYMIPIIYGFIKEKEIFSFLHVEVECIMFLIFRIKINHRFYKNEKL